MSGTVLCQDVPECPCAGSAVLGGRERGCLPSRAGTCAEGGDGTREPLRAGETRDVLALFFLSHSLSFELTLSCRMWEVTEVSLWCGVSWMKSVCRLCSALQVLAWLLYRKEGCGSSREWFNALASFALKSWEVESAVDGVFVWGLGFFCLVFCLFGCLFCFFFNSLWFHHFSVQLVFLIGRGNRIIKEVLKTISLMPY